MYILNAIHCISKVSVALLNWLDKDIIVHLPFKKTSELQSSKSNSEGFP